MVEKQRGVREGRNERENVSALVCRCTVYKTTTRRLDPTADHGRGKGHWQTRAKREGQVCRGCGLSSCQEVANEDRVVQLPLSSMVTFASAETSHHAGPSNMPFDGPGVCNAREWREERERERCVCVCESQVKTTARLGMVFLAPCK